MIRVPIFVAVSLNLFTSAAAQSLPEIDIKAHCAHIGDSLVATCTINESYARLWLEYHQIDIRMLYQCTRTLKPMGAGYGQLRACVLSNGIEALGI